MTAFDHMARLYGESYAEASHGDAGPVERDSLAETAYRDAFEVIDRQDGREIIHPAPEHWIWHWPFWLAFVACVAYFAAQFTLGLIR